MVPLRFLHTYADVSQGLDGLGARCAKYYEAGARFAKWRAVISIPDGPSRQAVFEAAYGLARYGAISQSAGLVPIIEPEVLLVDILLPGIDGATLIAGLRSHPAFARSQLIVVTSLEGAALEPYAFALEGLPVVHKPRLAVELPALLAQALAPSDAAPRRD